MIRQSISNNVLNTLLSITFKYHPVSVDSFIWACMQICVNTLTPYISIPYILESIKLGHQEIDSITYNSWEYQGYEIDKYIPIEENAKIKYKSTMFGRWIKKPLESMIINAYQMTCKGNIQDRKSVSFRSQIPGEIQ